MQVFTTTTDTIVSEITSIILITTHSDLILSITHGVFTTPLILMVGIADWAGVPPAIAPSTVQVASLAGLWEVHLGGGTAGMV